MGFIKFNYRSEAIGKYLDISIVYPTDIYSYYDMAKEQRHHLAPGEKLRTPYKRDMKFQTVYLIHGGGDDNSLTYRYTNAERYAQKNNVMLVTPDVSNSFGADTNYGTQYGTFLTEELPVVMQTLFASSPRRKDNFIMGYAMGGNVALSAALRCPEKYTTCIDMSGGIGYTVNLETLKDELKSDHFRNNFPLYNSTFGEPSELEGSRHDLYKIATQNLKEKKELPNYYFIYGSEEGFIGDRVKADADTLREIGYDVSEMCVEGYRHDFDLWDMSIKLALDELLPLNRDPLL